MKKILLRVLWTLGATLLFSSVVAQDSPVVSTEAEPVWFKIESACTQPVVSASYTGLGDLRGYVLFDPVLSDNRIYARQEAGGDSELWALVQSGSVVKLKNKGTGRYMVNTHSLNTTGEQVTYGEYGSKQYWIKSGTYNPLIIWNGLKCDRWSAGAINSNTAFYFRIQADPKVILGSVIQSATTLKTRMTGTDPGFVAPGDTAVVAFDAAISSASAVYNATTGTPDYTGAKAALESAMEIFRKAPVNPVTVSTTEKDTWYYLVSAGTAAYCSGKVMLSRGSDPGQALEFGVKAKDPALLWKMTDAGNGKYAIRNKASGLYAGLTSGAYTSVKTSAEPVAYTIEYLGEKGEFSIRTEGADPLHCQESGSVVVNWPGGLDSPSAWRLEEVQDPDAPVVITGLTVKNGVVATGKGQKNYALLYFTLKIEGFSGTPLLESVTIDLEGTTQVQDVTHLSVYSLNGNVRYHQGEHTPAGTATPASGAMLIRPETPLSLQVGENYFALVTDISDNATEGNLVKGRVLSAKLVTGEFFEAPQPSVPFPATIFLSQSTLFSPGDLGSKFYRIPAIVTAKDGSLVTATDRRNNHEGDLPADIDTYIRRSTDKGVTWNEPVMIAGAGTSAGFGDPALVVEKESGKIFCLIAHNQGFFGSTASNPIRITLCESSDNGITWTQPADITSMLYGSECNNNTTRDWNGLFISSGRGLQLRNGRLMFVGVVRGSASGIDNYVVYSDDQGKTWQVNINRVHQGGDEAKLAQRDNGDVVISIRNAPKREWNMSTTNGDTWGTSVIHPDLTDPNCNGEIMTYTATSDGYEKNRMLHSLAYAGNRSNVSMLLSYDEGLSFPVRKTICPAPSAYSTFTVLPDGTIGMYYEDGSIGGGFDMVFVRFSLSWLTDGKDIYAGPVTGTRVLHDNRQDINILVKERRIVVPNTGNESLSVYNLLGVRMDPEGILQPGIYIVKVGNSSTKVLVR